MPGQPHFHEWVLEGFRLAGLLAFLFASMHVADLAMFCLNENQSWANQKLTIEEIPGLHVRRGTR